MAEPESLKRAVYLKVEVDLTLRAERGQLTFGDDVSLVCNTSYQVPTTAPTETDGRRSRRSAAAIKSSRTSHSHPTRMVWYKDGLRLHNGHALNAGNSNLALVGGLNNLSLAAQLLDFKIEYHTRPVLWSRLVLRSFKPTDLGIYTCQFRHQNVSTVIALSNCKETP